MRQRFYRAKHPGKPRVRIQATAQQIAARRRWIKCNRCKRWCKHFVREYVVSLAQIAEVEGQESAPTGEPFDQNFEQTGDDGQSN